jgi:hypothetical protein
VDEAVAMSKRSVELMAKLRSEHPDTRRYRINTPRLLHNDGLTLIEAGKVDEGLAQIRKGLDEFAGLAVWEPTEPAHRFALAKSTTGYAEALMMQPGTTDSALAALGNARTTLEQLARDAPDDAEIQRRIAAVHYDTGRLLLLRRNDAAGALREASTSSAILRANVERDPGNEDAVVSGLISRTFEGHVRAAAGQPERAEAMLRSLMPQLERLAKADTTDVRFPQQLIEAKFGMALVEIARASAAAGAASATHWRLAREWLQGARRDLDRLHARVGPWTLSREESQAIDRAIARCEEALST